MSRKHSVLAGILVSVIYSFLIFHSSAHHSPVFNEVGHLPSGLAHWKYQDYSLYRVNPPLPRLVAAIPVLFSDHEEDWSRFDNYSLKRSQILIGSDFIQANGIDHQRLYFYGRLACLPFALAGAWGCFLWSRDLWGNLAGVWAMWLWCFSPMILGNSALIMPDVPAAATGVWSAFSFWKWLKQPSGRNTLLCGLLLGLAELTKFTLLIFYVLFPLIWLVQRLINRVSHVTCWKRDAGQLCFMFVLSVYIINLGYDFSGSFKKLGEFTFLSEVLAGQNGGERPVADNRFKDSWLADVPVPLPEDYLQGLDRQKADFDGKMWSYLRGEWQLGGWWYFYVYALFIKTPIGILILYGVSTFILFHKRYRSDFVSELCILSPALVVISLVSSQTAFSIHPRYIIPALPFLFISVSRVARSFEFKNHALFLFATVLLVWATGSSLWYYPHSIAYFNEIAGGPKNGHRHLLDSGSAWGQDLLFLKEWYDDHPEARPFHVASFGWIDPHYVGIAYTMPPLGPVKSGGYGGELEADLGPKPGWYAVDVNHLMGTVWGAPTGDGDWRNFWVDFGKPVPDFTYFQEYEPVDRVAYSYLIYHISVDEANRVRCKRGLPELNADDSSGTK